MNNKTDVRSSLASCLGLAIKGFCMGAADVVPGVSGGTMAFILGIYQELIRSLGSFDYIFFKHLFSLKLKKAFNHAALEFLLPLGIGIMSAVFTLAKILSWLLQNKPVLLWSFFFGLIVASIFIISKRLKKWGIALIVWIALGSLSTYLLVGIVPTSTPDTPWFLFFSGFAAICAMILPGISGAFILVILGKYQYILEAVNNRDLLIISIVAAGAIAGLFFFVRILSWFFSKYHDFTIAILTGFMIGSLRKIWPWKSTPSFTADSIHSLSPAMRINVLPSHFDTELITAISLSIIGFLIVFALNFLAEKK